MANTLSFIIDLVSCSVNIFIMIEQKTLLIEIRILLQWFAHNESHNF